MIALVVVFVIVVVLVAVAVLVIIVFVVVVAIVVVVVCRACCGGRCCRCRCLCCRCVVRSGFQKSSAIFLCKDSHHKVLTITTNAFLQGRRATSTSVISHAQRSRLWIIACV